MIEACQSALKFNISRLYVIYIIKTGIKVMSFLLACCAFVLIQSYSKLLFNLKFLSKINFNSQVPSN